MAKTLLVKNEFLLMIDISYEEQKNMKIIRDGCLKELELAQDLFRRQNKIKYVSYCYCLQAKAKIVINDREHFDYLGARNLIEKALEYKDKVHDEKILKEVKADYENNIKSSE